MSFIQKNKKARKWTVSAVLVFFILTQVLGGVFFYARPAEAQLVVTDPITSTQTTIKNIKDFLKVLVVNAGTMALINAASRFMQKISYDLAVSLASGGNGQMPLFSTEGWGDYMANAGLDAAGEFIGSFGDMVGVNFCAPPNPRVGLALQLQLSQTYAEGLPPPTCEWSAIQSNWDSFISEVQTEDFLREAASQFQIGYGAGTDLDLAVSTYVGAFNAEQSASDTAALTREEGQGFLPSSELISGDIKTPSEVIRQTSQIQTEGPVEAEQLKWSLSGQALSAGAQGILTMMASTFVSTLLSKTMERIFSKGMYSLADLFPEGEDATSEEGTAWGGRRAAELAFADLLVPQIKESGAYDILSDFIVCPDKFKGTNNCVMDGKFEAAVRQAQTGEPLTVAEALGNSDADPSAYLHGNWPLYPPSNLAKNQDPNCYTYGYCYSNLVKLRKARIISIGWEIAAQSQTSVEPVSLKEVVDRFNDCNAAGEADTEHPYCHLIDPDWILKAPAEQCRARVYGPLLQTTENSFRQETCVDSPTCLAEDDQGNCEGGWGYCTREKNIWRLDGDKCDAQYDTCKLLKRSDGQNVAYVTNTADYGPPCNADDVGCRWYSTRQSKVGDIWQWQDTLTGSGTAAARRSDRIFFNKNIAQCDEPGCNEFLRTTAATKVNYITNSSFEDYVSATGIAGSGTPDDAIPEKFQDWDPNPMLAVSDTYFGKTALRLPPAGGRIIDIGKPIGGATFTLSFYAKKADAATACTGVFRLGKSFAVLGPDSADISSASDTWSRFSVSYTGDGASTELAFGLTGGSGCLIDAMQLEEGAYYTAYHEGWTNTGEAVYLKTAPDYYSCYDYTASGALNKTNDAEQCGNFARACEEKDVGCDEYRPTNGDPSVPGVANYPDDYCPAECVGYQTFKQVATDFEQDKFPVYFIPTTGRTCSAADAGCDQFTSLENEAVANFNYVRRCEKPGATSKSFYTWEGSDTAGYQLKTWSLKVSNVLSAPVSDSDPGDGVSPSGGVPPCTALAADGLTCDGLSSVGLCTKEDTLTNPDCREFYDAAGLKHYRLYSKTIVATDDCHPFRKTLSTVADCGSSGGRWDTVKSECIYNIYLPESRTCSNEAVGCRAYRGNAGANTAVVLNDNFDAAADGAATGWDEADMPTISSESLVVGGKSLTFGAAGILDKNLSSSVRQGGLYTLSFWAKGASRLDIKFLGADSAGKEFSSATKNPTNLSFDWRYFSLGPVYVDWSVVGGGETLRISAAGGTTPVYIDNIILREVQSYIYAVKNSWTTPISCDRSFAVDTSITDAVACGTHGGSWSADRSECVLSALLPQAQLGCASYYDRANGLHYLKSFSRLCSPDAAGCAKLLETNNNASAAAEIYNTENDSDPSLSDEERLSDNVTIPADEFSYIVVDNAYECAARNKGCAEFGSPTLDAAGNVKIDDSGKPVYDTVNLLADPALYNSPTGRILCQVGFLACEEYTTTDGGKLYFKNPGNRLCQWKDNVNLSGQNVSGWFKKQEKASDPLLACDPANFTGGYYNIWKNGDASCNLPYVCQTATGCSCTVGTAGATGVAGTTCTVSYNKRSCPYSGWVGECIPQADQCTKFTDPGDTANDPLGAAYYYINNDKIGSGNCNGMVSQRDGCVLFNDTSDPQLDYNANATYISSEKKTNDPGGLVAPINCAEDPGNAYCGRCLQITLGIAPAGKTYRFGNFCQSSGECPTGYQESSPTIPNIGGEGCVTVHQDQYSPGVGSSAPFRTIIPFSQNSNIVFDPSLSGQINDANRLVQVRRDRVCGEWLTCSGTTSTFDPQTGRQKTLCDTVSSCRKYAKVGQATAQCTDSNFTPETAGKILSKDFYISRDVTFKGMDFSGDSIYNQYQAFDLRVVNIGTEESPIQALGHVDERCFLDTGVVTSCATHPPGFCASETNGTRCGDSGKCYNNVCVTHFRGDPFAPGALLIFAEANAEKISCRAYPEQSSPFRNTVVKKWSPLSKQPGFAGANVCEEGEDCDCSYKKVSYGNGAIIKYFDKDKNPLPKLCVGGKEAGTTCDIDSDCGTGSASGTCNLPDREDVVLGWNGFCLERDTANSINGDPDQFACLTWYPTDQIPGMPDLFNNYLGAGFSLPNTNYCLAPAPYKVLLTNPTSGDYCANPGTILARAVAPGFSCESDLYCNRTLGEVRNAFSCGFDGTSFTDDDGHSCDLEKNFIFFTYCGGSCVDHYSLYDYSPWRCVPRNSVHMEGDDADTACDFHALDSLIIDNSGPIDSLGRKTAYYTLSNFTDDPSGPDINDFNDCQKEGITSLSITAKSYLGCAVTAKISGDNPEYADFNKAWTDRVWNFSDTDRTSVPYALSTPYSQINYTAETILSPFGHTLLPGDVNLHIPTCLKSDNTALNLPVGPVNDSVCPAGYALSPLTPIDSDGAVRNDARPYLWIGQAEAPPPLDSCTGFHSCNPGVSCVSYKCYRSCDSSHPCPDSESCTTPPGYCSSTEAGVFGADEDERRRDCASTQGVPEEDVIVLGDCNSGAYATRKCESDFRCYSRACSIEAGSTVGECVPMGSVPPSRVRTESGGLTVAKDRLKLIFAKSYGFMVWDPVAGTQSLGEYRGFTDSDYTESERNAIDITPKTDLSILDWPFPPQIWPITDCQGEKCKPLKEIGIGGRTPIQGITINGVSGFGFTGTGVTEPINVVGYGGELRATLQFFGQADKNAGPILKVTKDWNDGSTPIPTTGRYQNHLGREACNNSDFAHSTDACTEDYFYSTHTYTCSSTASSATPACTPDRDSNCFAAICPEDVNGGLAGNGSCCVFKPRVQLKDNWGWCNGDCGRGTSKGCYDASDIDGEDECRTSNMNDASTPFAGRVIVVPK